MFVYNVLMTIGVIVSLPVLIWLGWVRKHHIRERIGIYNGRINSFLNGKRPIWFHAASVGEVRVLAALIPAYLRESHNKKIIVSTVTKTGREEAKKILPKECLAIFMPIDLRIFVHRAFDVINPKALILTETEFWPNLICYANEKGIKTFCINGRLSDKSYPKYKLAKPLVRRVLSCIDYFFMQSKMDAERLVALGVDKSKVLVFGNIKYDLAQTDLRIKKGVKAAEKPIWAKDKRVLVAGSTHKGEEEVILDAYNRLRENYDDVLLILAPRHLSRAKEIKALIEKNKLRAVMRSEIKAGRGGDYFSSEDIIVLDTMGELRYVYNWGEAAFVGGSLDKTGGHNPLEPAAWGIPVVFGPNMRNCRDIADSLVDEGGAKVIHNADELYLFFNGLLSDDEIKQEMGYKAGLVSEEKRGVSVKVAERLYDLISHKKSRFQPAETAG